MSLNKLILSSKKNLNSVKTAVILVQGPNPQAIQLMGGVNVLSNIVLAAISLGSVTVGQAADRVEQGLAKAIPIHDDLFPEQSDRPGRMPGSHPQDPQPPDLTGGGPCTRGAR